MQKFTKLIILILTLALSNSQILPVPQQMTQLVTGLLSELNLPEKLGANNCREEINIITSKVKEISTDLTSQNYVAAFIKTSEIFQKITVIITKCPEIKSKMQENLDFLNSAYHAPGLFLHNGLDNNISFSGLKNLYYLLDELKENDLTEAGKILAKVLQKFSDFNLQSKSLLFLANSDVKNDDPCLKILEALSSDLKTMLKNLFSDINAVKAALDHFMMELKRIPEVCLA